MHSTWDYTKYTLVQHLGSVEAAPARFCVWGGEGGRNGTWHFDTTGRQLGGTSVGKGAPSWLVLVHEGWEGVRQVGRVATITTSTCATGALPQWALGHLPQWT